jgi:hypothetical protein
MTFFDARTSIHRHKRLTLSAVHPPLRIAADPVERIRHTIQAPATPRQAAGDGRIPVLRTSNSVGAVLK